MFINNTVNQIINFTKKEYEKPFLIYKMNQEKIWYNWYWLKLLKSNTLPKFGIQESASAAESWEAAGVLTNYSGVSAIHHSRVPSLRTTISSSGISKLLRR